MLPIGYNAKIIEAPKEWLGNSKVKEILSVSECISESPECSPLSCNSGAKEFPVNRYCLIDTLEEALRIAEAIDKDGGYEPGPYGIMSVWEQIR